MRIVADENIPQVARAFARLGDVVTLAGRSMTAADVATADILLVRSVTRVDESLLRHSNVRFVASATIGFDHIDRNFLARNGIGFACAPGSNATSAAEYVLSVIHAVAEQRSRPLAGLTAGIIGVGNVGTRVARLLSAVGIECLLNDPPLQESGAEKDFVDLHTALQADIVTVHVPLTRTGKHATYHLLNEDNLGAIRKDCLLINAARGAAIDNMALLALLEAEPERQVALDVWEHEPEPNLDLLRRVAIATPHIAGYSVDGKLRGTEMIYRAVCKHLQVQPTWSAAETDAGQTAPEMRCETKTSAGSALGRKILHAYDVRRDDQRMRQLLDSPAEELAARFDHLRKAYPARREFSESLLFNSETALEMA